MGFITKNKNAFKAFNAFVKKEFFHIFRDVRTMMIVLLMPIIQILLFGFALSSEVNNINFATLDLARDAESRKVLENFSQSKYFTFRREISSVAELESVFDDNKIDLAIVFPNNFAKDGGVQFLLDASDPNYASMINLYALNTYNNALLANSRSAVSQTPPITPLTTMLFNPQGESVYNFVPGLLGLVLMLICAMMTSISIVREKEQGSMEVLLVSPIKPLFMIVAKIIPYFAISFVSLVAVLLVSVFVMELKIAGNIAFVVGFCMLYITLTLSIGLLVSTLVKTQVTAMLICGLVFMMPVMMLSGMIFPLESMPKILQYLALILPPNWFITGLKKIMIEGLGLEFVLKEIGILFFMCLVVIIVSLKKFSTRLES